MSVIQVHNHLKLRHLFQLPTKIFFHNRLSLLKNVVHEGIK